jgi:hypothetical protein
VVGRVRVEDRALGAASAVIGFAELGGETFSAT